MKKEKRRRVEVVVISDVHLGTYGCQASELLKYLKTIHPEKLILNGDIIDMWQFSKRYWPVSHMEVIKYITSVLSRKTEVIYITGNHDEMLRRFVGFQLGSFRVENKVVLHKDGKKAWIFHGDVFDVTMQYSKWLARLGAIGYDALILLNTFVNYLLSLAGCGKISLSKRIKDSVKSAVRFIEDFENVAAGIAIENDFDYVICGHIHRPQKRTISTKKGSVMYLNSGDWVENKTALEYNDGEWSIYDFNQDEVMKSNKLKRTKKKEYYKTNNELFKNMVSEFSRTATASPSVR